MMMDCSTTPTPPPPNKIDDTPKAPTSHNAAPGIEAFDIDSYISRYEEDSCTRLERLIFIASNITCAEISKTAYQLAEKQMKSMGNTKRYKEVFGSMDDGVNSVVPFDSEWVHNTDITAQSQLETLKARLSSAQSHLSKDSIRLSFSSLASFYKRRGELRDAMRCLLSKRDYCTTNPQIAQVCVEIMEVGIDWKNYGYVHTYYTKAKHTADLFTSAPPLTQSKLEAALVLALLSEGNFYQACHKFISLSSEMQFPSLISQEDIVLYTALLALATLDRPTLQRHILQNSTFQQRLESHPPLRDALRHFSRAEYGPSLQLFNQLRPTLKLDLHLHPHVDELIQRIVNRSIVTYFYPYKSVSIQKMADTFYMSPQEIEQVVHSLILKNRIPPNTFLLRIDARNGIIRSVIPSKKQRKRMVTKVQRLGVEFIHQTESLLFRSSCLEHDLVVLPEDDAYGGGQRSGSGRGGGQAMTGRGRSYGIGEVENLSSEEEDRDVSHDQMMMDLDDPEYIG